MQKPKHSCSAPGCRNLVTTGSRCPEHKPTRPSARAMGYSPRWDEYSKRYLQTHPICANPFGLHSAPVPAVITGHKVAHKGNQQLMWNPGNHYPLCLSCNSTQCCRTEGGFGRDPEVGQRGRKA